MAPTITKSTLQSNEANHGSYPIAVHDQDDANDEEVIGEELLHQNSTSDMQLESILTEFKDHG